MGVSVQNLAFLAFTGSGAVATLLMIIAIATPNWIEVRETSFKEAHGLSVQFSMETYSGLWKFCYTIRPKEDIGEVEESCDSISYRDFRLQLQYESFLQPMVTFSLINNFKMGMPLYMTSLGFLIVANVVSMFQNANRIFFPFINAILLIFSSLLLSMGCIYFIGAVDFEGLNDHPEVIERPVAYKFGYGFKLVWVSFLLENLAIAVNVYLWMSYRSEELKHQRENLASFKTIAMQMVPLSRNLGAVVHGAAGGGGGVGGPGSGASGGRGSSSVGLTTEMARHSVAASVEPSGICGAPGGDLVEAVPGRETQRQPPQQPQQEQSQDLELALRHWAFLKSPAKLSRLEQKRADSLARQVMVRAATK